MEQIWDEKRIRAEMARLDGLTGLHGASLPISFGKARQTLGVFIIAEDGLRFRFSSWWFQNPSWPEECALDVIRHEYAHYMNWERYGNRGHGPTWKTCCIAVGASPARLYQRELEDYYRSRRSQEEEFGRYRAGDLVLHPRFGMGTVQRLTGEWPNRFVVADFGPKGVKKLDIRWVSENCAIEHKASHPE